MSGKRFTQEFKDEAIRQVTERGHAVSDVASRLGISQHSLYRWIRAAKPSIEGRQGFDLEEANKEIKRLQKDLHRTREERDILKKAAARSMGHRNTMTTHTLRKDMVTDAKTKTKTFVGGGDRRALASVARGRLPERHLARPRPKAWLHLPSSHRGRRRSASAPSAQSRAPVFCRARRDFEGALCGALASKRGRSSWSISFDRFARSAA